MSTAVRKSIGVSSSLPAYPGFVSTRPSDPSPSKAPRPEEFRLDVDSNLRLSPILGAVGRDSPVPQGALAVSPNAPLPLARKTSWKSKSSTVAIRPKPPQQTSAASAVAPPEGLIMPMRRAPPGRPAPFTRTRSEELPSTTSPADPPAPAKDPPAMPVKRLVHVPLSTQPRADNAVDTATYEAASVRTTKTTKRPEPRPQPPLPPKSPAAAAGPSPSPLALWSSPSKKPLMNIRHGTVHTYDAVMPLGMRLQTSLPQMVILEASPIHSGSNYDIFQCWLLDEKTKKGQLFVAKKLLNMLKLREHFMAFQLCAHYMRLFNAEHQLDLTVMLPNRLLEYGGDFFMLQEHLSGTWGVRSEVIDAFSHFCFAESGCNFTFLDFKGDEKRFASFRLASRRPEPYGLDCAQTDEIVTFFDSHVCGALCDALSPSSPLPLAKELPDLLPPPRESVHEWAWLEDNGRSSHFSPEMQHVLKEADADQGIVRVTVGGITTSALDPKRKQVVSLEDGTSKYLHRRPPRPPPAARTTFLQVEVDAGWHSYSEAIQDAAHTALQNGLRHIRLMMNDREYEFDFQRMEQVNAEAGTKRSLRFVQFMRVHTEDLVE